MREVFYRMEVYQDSLQKKYKDRDTSICLLYTSARWMGPLIKVTGVRNS